MVVDNQSQVNGIEVSLASEAAGKVGLLISAGVEFTAKGVNKAQIAFRVFERELENRGDEIVNLDLITN